MATIKQLIEESHAIAKKKGFWEEKKFLEKLMLIVSELAEAAEAYRKNDQPHVAEELADAAIRLFDLAGGFEIALEEEIEKKMRFNRTRPYKHGRRC